MWSMDQRIIRNLLLYLERQAHSNSAVWSVLHLYAVLLNCGQFQLPTELLSR